jgi:hypothetical protein
VKQTNESYNKTDLNQTKYQLAMKLSFPSKFARAEGHTIREGCHQDLARSNAETSQIREIVEPFIKPVDIAVRGNFKEKLNKLEDNFRLCGFHRSSGVPRSGWCVATRPYRRITDGSTVAARLPARYPRRTGQRDWDLSFVARAELILQRCISAHGRTASAYLRLNIADSGA